MAVIKGSALGKFSKSLGDVTTAVVNGQNIARMKPASYNDANTQTQQNVRTTLAAGVGLYKLLEPIIKIGYNNRPRTESKYNAFIKNVMNNTLPVTVKKIQAEIEVFTKEAVAKTPIIPGSTPISSGNIHTVEQNLNSVTYMATFNDEVKQKVKYTGKRANAMMVIVDLNSQIITVKEETDIELLTDIEATLTVKDIATSDTFAVLIVYSEDMKIVGTSVTRKGWA